MAEEARRHRASAFGLDLDLSFAAPGLPQAGGPGTGRRTRVDLASAASVDRGWPGDGAERVLEERFGGAEPERTIDVHSDAGYRLYARGFGLARISSSGDRVVCSPPGEADWRWQRFLVGRVLPWAAVLRGLEAFHAGAVALGGRAAAFVGPTGAGKTALAVRLVARGAGFLTDDVMALETRDGEVVAHPGASVASLRAGEAAAIDGAEVLGTDDKTYVALPREAGPVPLAAVYFLRPGEGPALEPIARPDPRLLLASTFVHGVRTDARLRNQLDVCAELARGVPMFALRARAVADADALAAVVDEHAREMAGA